MSKLIAVNGPPGSGKTITSLKLAQEIYAITHKSVMFVSPDHVIPTMGIIFPHSKQAKIQSIGKTLDRTNIYQDDVIAATNTTKFMENFGYLGYKTGEDQFTYPAPTDGKITDMFQSMKQIAEYIVVDCDRDQNEQISSLARGYADHVISLFNPNLQSMSFYGQNLIPEGTIKTMVILDKDLLLPQKEVIAHFRGTNAKIPYSRAVKQQSLNGTLTQFVKDSGYRHALTQLAKAVI